MAPSPEPFQLSIPETALADLKARLAMTRFPDQAPDDRWACGTDIEYLRSLVGYCKRWSCYLPTLCKSVALGAAFLGGIAIGANADPLCHAGVDSCQPPAGGVAALPPADSAPPPHSATLPNVDIFGGQLNLHPYSSPGVGPRVSSFGTVRAEHYEVPADFDTNVSLHPYTSGVGPWPSARQEPPSHHYRKSPSPTTPSSGTP